MRAGLFIWIAQIVALDCLSDAKDINERFELYKIRHGKVYESPEEVRGGENKSGLSCLNSSYSANSRPIKMYYIPNQWKFNEDFAELCRFEIAALIEA